MLETINFEGVEGMERSTGGEHSQTLNIAHTVTRQWQTCHPVHKYVMMGPLMLFCSCFHVCMITLALGVTMLKTERRVFLFVCLFVLFSSSLELYEVRYTKKHQLHLHLFSHRVLLMYCYLTDG